MKRRSFIALPVLGLFRPKWKKCVLHCAVTNGIIKIGLIDVLNKKIPDWLMTQIKSDIGLR